MYRSAFHHPKLYLAGTILWSYTGYGLLLFSGLPWYGFPGGLIMMLAGLGPAISATSLRAIEGGRQAAIEHLKASFDPKDTQVSHLLVLLLLLISISLLPALIAPASEAPFFSPGPPLFLLIGLVFGGLEEVGWRAYGQRALERHHSPLIASLIIGGFWALWHLPLFFLPGTYQAGLGLVSIEGAVFFSALVIGSPLYAWLLHLRRATPFIPLLYHGASNVVRELLREANPVVSLLFEGTVVFIIVLLHRELFLPRK